MKHKYLKNVTTLAFDSNKCVGCGRCMEVCPHGVFDMSKEKVYITDKDLCMECGACALNCPAKAIEVNAGVGCAVAIIYGWFTGSEPSCGCSDTGFGCGPGSSCCGTVAVTESTVKTLLTIEWRHLDVDGQMSARSYDTGENLVAEVKRLNMALNPQGIAVKYIEKKLDESQISESNTLFFNGTPLEELLNIEVSENHCCSCTDLLGKATNCRTIIFEGDEYEAVPAKAIRQAAYKVLGLI